MRGDARSQSVSSETTIAGRLAVVIATRNRRDSLLRTLRRLEAIEERPNIVVVDNASSDSTAAAVKRLFPGVRVIALSQNMGPFARTLGATAVSEEYVAFCDDDSWWQTGALVRAVGILDEFPALALVAAHILVGPSEDDDPTTLAMARSPLRAPSAFPGPRVLGFLACGAIVRRGAFLSVGGFRERAMGFEETTLAVELNRAGWGAAYVPEVVAHHHPSPVRDLGVRRQNHARNAIWFAWTHRPLRVAVAMTMRFAVAAVTDDAVRRGLLEALGELRRLPRERCAVDLATEADLQLLDL